jgi:hypothetical protein
MKNPPPDAANDRESADSAPIDPEIQALLDFEPVPRKIERADGWTAERQRAFIAAFAVTGSPRRAARAIGMSAGGLDRLRTLEGAEGFNDAWRRAMALWAERDSRRIADGVVDAARQRPRSRGRPSAYSAGFSPPLDGEGRGVGCFPEDEADDEAARSQEWLDGFLAKYWHKVVAEREARLNGEIVAADFYLRQLTFLEVAIDLASGGRGFEQLRRLRRDGHRLSEIAETSFSRIIDDMRRHIWRKMGEPERPEHPPRRLLVEHEGAGGYATEPLECLHGPFETHAEQKARFEQQHEEAAREQAEWERRAHEEWQRRSSLSLDGRGQGEGDAE